ncbi:MAG: TIGR02757 family protein [Bacteroidota bacterium]|jgi:uncharacterized protein (TIGR02757 family)
MNHEELKDFLDFKAAQYENPQFLSSDPIQIPHRYSKKEDIEIMALLTATIAWGNRSSIIKSSSRIAEIMGDSPHDYVLNFADLRSGKSRFVHRTFNEDDLKFFFNALNRIYHTGGLEMAFQTHQEITGIKGRIMNFRAHMLNGQEISRTSKHLSDPSKNSAAKRLNMFLRWMVRPSAKGVDFGLWKSIQPSELYLPLDVHTGNNARKLGLLTRKQDDWKALEEIMTSLRSFDSVDPVKYDFALFGLGAFEKF